MLAFIALFFPAAIMVVWKRRLFKEDYDWKTMLMEYIAGVVLINFLVIAIAYLFFGSEGSIVSKINTYSNFALKYILLSVLMSFLVPWACLYISKNKQNILQLARIRNNTDPKVSIFAVTVHPKGIRINRTFIIIGIITLIGLTLRVICCFWGFPYQLHPDEPTIVSNVISMLSRNSWEAYVYNRPDQFEIKCNAIIFQISSYLKYGVSADVAFNAGHTAFFYTLARLYTTAFGTAIIPLSALLAGRIFRRDKINVQAVQIITAGVFAFSYIFVQHSAYATPDIPLTFFVMLIQYISLRYLESGKIRDIYIISLLTGMACTIKYPAAVITLYIAFIVIYKCVKEKEYIKIIKTGIICFLIILATMFVIAPNLFTDINSLIAVFKTEMRTTHLGADGLGFWGNLRYYFTSIMNSLGIVGLVGFVAGIVHLLISRKKEHFPLLVNAIFWICLSKMALHWLRWGFPMYVAYILIGSSGIVWIYGLIKQVLCSKVEDQKSRKIWVKVIQGIGVISCVSILFSAVSVTVSMAREDIRVAALDYCEENKITTENCIYEGYTPYALRGGKNISNFFYIDEDGELHIDEEYQNYEYFIMGSSYKNRYYAEPEKYSSYIELYEAVEEEYELVAVFEGDSGSYSMNEILNIGYGINYLLNGSNLSGGTNWIYKLK